MIRGRTPRATRMQKVTESYILNGQFLNFGEKHDFRNDLMPVICKVLFEEYLPSNEEFGTVNFNFEKSKLNALSYPQQGKLADRARQYLFNRLTQTQLTGLLKDKELCGEWQKVYDRLSYV